MHDHTYTHAHVHTHMHKHTHVHTHVQILVHLVTDSYSPLNFNRSQDGKCYIMKF